ncbi:hypothetical protein [Roseovarius sp.]|uniref:hypothetical protein n=1 Tax=Roseovarius sp. TaxID=1486281 RepID=UPI003B5ABF4E
MEIVPSTFLALVAAATLLWIGPFRGLWAFVGLAPFGAAAAFNLPALGGATIGQLEFTLCIVFFIAIARHGGPDRILGTLRPLQPGFFLLLLLIYCFISAVFFPRIFAGDTEIFGLSRAVNEDRIISIPLAPSSGNITQSFYFLLSSLVFLALATLYRLRPDEGAVFKALVICTSVNFALGVIDVVSAAAGLKTLMDPLRTANYAMAVFHEMAGIKRMVGGMPEASAFGSFSVVLFGFWLHYWTVSARSRLVTAMLLIALFCVLRSTSSGAYVALVLLLVYYSIAVLFRSAGGAFPRRVAFYLVTTIAVAWLAGIAMLVGYHMFDVVERFLNETLFSKLQSDSGVERMAWNAQAYKNFTDTWLMGAGLGSVRASNWFMACLGSLGVLGTALYLLFLASLFSAPARTGSKPRDNVIQALKVACLAQIIAAMLTAATPNLGTLFFIFAGLVVGLSRSRIVVRAEDASQWLAHPRPAHGLRRRQVP